MRFIGDCSGLGNHLEALSSMIEKATPVTYRTFRRHIGGDELDQWASNHGYSLHYSSGLILKNDWHVAYYKSKWYDRLCYFLVWSAYENVWVKD